MDFRGVDARLVSELTTVLRVEPWMRARPIHWRTPEGMNLAAQRAGQDDDMPDEQDRTDALMEDE